MHVRILMIRVGVSVSPCTDRRRVYPYNLIYTDRSHVAECMLMIRVGVSVSRCRLKVTLHH